MKLSLHSRAEIPNDVWDQFIADSDSAWMWHLSDIQDSMLKWPWRKDFSFAVKDLDSGNLVAIVPIQLIERPIFPSLKKRKLDSFGGPAFSNALSMKQLSAVKHFIQEQLSQIETQIRPWEVVFSLAPMTPSLRGEACPRVNPLLHLGCQNSQSQTWIIDLRQDVDSIYKNYSESTRRKIRRAMEVGYKIREASGPRDAEIYYQLHTETYRRSSLSPHPKPYHLHLFEHVVPKGNGRYLFCELNGHVVAAVAIAIFKGGAYYWMGGSLTDKSGMETQLLMHHQILYAKEMGCSFFDCGEAYPQYSEGKLKGMSEFKRGFGGELYPLFRGYVRPKSRLQKSLSIFEHTLKEFLT